MAGDCLMVMIDDATGVTRRRFFSGETLGMFGRWSGKFESLYVDRAGMYRCDREPTLQEL